MEGEGGGPMKNTHKCQDIGLIQIKLNVKVSSELPLGLGSGAGGHRLFSDSKADSIYCSLQGSLATESGKKLSDTHKSAISYPAAAREDRK